ncbi:MAG: LCP family protein, partial [Solobacterium sp.]|nr:LCP family protein [Solobacterium sp.]
MTVKKPRPDSRQRPEQRPRPESKPKSNSNRFHRDMSKVNIVVTVLAVITNIAMMVTLFNSTRFANLSGKTFTLVNILCIIVLLAMNMALLFGIRNRIKSVFITGVVLMAAMLGIGLYGTYALGRVNRNVDKMTSTTTKESVSTSLIVYSDSGTQRYSDVSQLDGRSVGFATGTQTANLGKARLESEKTNVSYSEYQDYSSLILALFNGEIECAILPTNYKNLFGNESGMEEFLANTASILDFESTVTVENTSGSDKDLTKDPFTVLLIGNADGLSDTMILCSVNPISMKVTMSSFARDSYVPITCYGGNSSKLNAAHAVSRDCLIATIENLSGVKVDYYVDTNFKGVVQVVDALGGIVVDSPIEFVGQNSDSDRGAYTVWVPAGKDVLLNGEQALAFARERHLFASGDFARQEHQQEVIAAILRKIMRTRDINTLLDVMDAAGDNIQTNMTLSQMTGFMNYAMKKANRYYDQDHVEKVVLLQGGRVTGYSSGLWDEGL